MVQRVAITTIRELAVQGKAKTKDDAAVRPKFRTIKAGTLLELDGAKLADLTAQDAVVKLSDPRAEKFGYGPKVAKGYVPRTPISKDEVVDDGDEGQPAPAPNRAAVSADRELNDSETGEPDEAGDDTGEEGDAGNDVASMKSHKAIDQYASDIGVELPEGWEDFKLDEKKAVLTGLMNNREDASHI